MPAIPAIEPYSMPGPQDLPENVAPWVVSASRTVLMVHDMQQYFMRPFPEGQSPGKELLEHCSLLREACIQLGVPVAYTAQPGGMTKDERGLLKDFWGAGMVGDSADRDIVHALAPTPDDWMMTKWRYSAFFRSDLLKRMRESDRDQLVICGVYAHVGVLTTAVEAFTNDIQTFLVADAVADFSADFHWLALRYAAQRCAVVRNTASILGDLESTPAGIESRQTPPVQPTARAGG